MNNRESKTLPTKNLLRIVEFEVILSSSMEKLCNRYHVLHYGPSSHLHMLVSLSTGLESEFLKSQEFNLIGLVLVLVYIHDLFFTWTHGDEKLKSFLDDLNKYPNIKFKHEFDKNSIFRSSS